MQRYDLLKSGGASMLMNFLERGCVWSEHVKISHRQSEKDVAVKRSML